VNTREDEDEDEKRDLVSKIRSRQGTVEQAEQWLTRLRDIDPSFFRSHPGSYLERQTAARRIYDTLHRRMGDRLSKDQLIELVSKIQHDEGTEEEQEAWLWLVAENVPDPTVYYRPEERTAEDIVERALASQPIVIGPAPQTRA